MHASDGKEVQSSEAGPSVSRERDCHESSCSYKVQVLSIKPLGQGVSGIVLPATILESNHPAALKIYCLCEDSLSVAANEASIYIVLQDLQGKQIPNFYGTGVLPITGDACLAMRYVPH